MSKIKLLLDVITDVRTLADSLQTLADTMAENEVSETDVVYEKEVVKEKKQQSKKSSAKKEFTLEDVRGVLAIKSKDGFTEQIKEIINSFGVDKLSDVEPSNYEDLLKEAEKLE